MPDQCDFIVVNRKLVSGGSILVLWLTVALVAVVVMEDMNEAGLTLTLLEHALGQRRENPLSRTIVAIFWCSFNIRLFLLPTAVAITTTAVLLIASPTATNILMNGLVITVLTTLDDVLAQLLPQSLIGRAEQVLAAPFASAASRAASQGSWRSGHKLAAVFTSGGIPVFLVHMDFMLGLPMLNTAHGAGRLCTAIPQCLMRAWVFCCVAITLSRPVTHFYRSSLLSYLLPFCSQERAKAIDLVLVPLLVFFVFVLVLGLGVIIHTIPIHM
uniref:Uncharacterized protein n=1 Tax=Alexandrium catenella TaxID=2925 RepID=A0A7S1LJ65_ALECA|mmetsp:Transcript_113507/g.301623  ORF Transcript_113507/g.301623 Transcript_113507/m.301623 type:complete len:271 (+) Transcript_113507:1-813(+)